MDHVLPPPDSELSGHEIERIVDCAKVTFLDAIGQIDSQIFRAAGEAAENLASEIEVSGKFLKQKEYSILWQERACLAVRAGDDKLVLTALSRKRSSTIAMNLFGDQILAHQMSGRRIWQKIEHLKTQRKDLRRQLILIVLRQCRTSQYHIGHISPLPDIVTSSGDPEYVAQDLNHPKVDQILGLSATDFANWVRNGGGSIA